ncbi:FAD-linked sulfhydryl oxidase ALR [Drosophila tropicalis]|uniref:FAD-linked sulfhydryl oxidase ALR n=1 Tax=Drosophila tropicalis TaxID=46794 RepID=UPI0035AB9DB4
MRLLFTIFTTAERSYKVLGLSRTTALSLLIPRHSHNYNFNQQQQYISGTREEARLIIRRLQKTILRILRNPDFNNMATPSFQQDQQQHEDESQFNSHASRQTGKQDSNCRTCNDFKSWSKQQRLISNAQNAKEKHLAVAEKLTVKAQDADQQRDDCPLDKVRLGISTWGLLHTMAAFYSDNPTDREKRDMKTFFEVLSRLYPCEFCAKDFRTDLDVNPINVNSQKDLTLWLCKFHNRVNDKLGKPIFDCSKVNERWRDGWLDGSCD